MSYTLRFLPELEEDVMAAHDWYEGKSAGLGAEFLRSFYAHVAILQRTPLIYPQIYQDFRRGLLRRFPYACYYRIAGELVIIYGAFHCARDPATISESLGNRRER